MYIIIKWLQLLFWKELKAPINQMLFFYILHIIFYDPAYVPKQVKMNKLHVLVCLIGIHL